MSKLVEFSSGQFVDSSSYDLETKKINLFSKLELYHGIQIMITGAIFDSLGPGSKEHRNVFERACFELGLEAQKLTKIELAREIVSRCELILPEDWELIFFSAGDTVTLDGLKFIYLSVWCNKNKINEGDTFNAIPVLNKDNIYVLKNTLIESNARENVDIFSEILTLLNEISNYRNELYWDEELFDSGDYKEIVYDLFSQLYQSSITDKEEYYVEILDVLGISRSNTTREIAEILLSVITDIKTALVGDNEIEDLSDIKKITTKIINDSHEAYTPTAKGQVSAKVDVWVIYNFIQHLQNDQLNLDPSFQRMDVWGIIDAQKLIISILRGVPLPSVIIQEDSSNVFTIVDGKQRLTSILRFLGIHPLAKKYIDAKIKSISGITDNEKSALHHLYRTDYKLFKSTLKDSYNMEISAKNELENYLPFKLPKNADEEISLKQPISLGDKYYTDIVKSNTYARFAGSNYDIPIKDVFYAFPQGFKIPVIIFNKETSSNQIQEVFTIYNKQGKKLNADEIRNASYHNLRLANILMLSTGEKSFEGNDPLHGIYKHILGKFNTIEESFNDYFKIPLNRFGRSKILSNATSFLFDMDNLKISMSTTNRINSLYEDVKENKFLNNLQNYENLVDLFYYATQLHQRIGDNWHSDFKNSKKNQNKWEELQTTATILGLIKVLNLGPTTDDLALLYRNNFDIMLEKSTLENISNSILNETQNCSKNGWQRPEKSQSKQQNEYISFLSDDIATKIIQCIPIVGTKDISSSIGSFRSNLNRLKL